MTECTFSMLAGPGDISHVERILRHLLKMCAFDFREVIVVEDDCPKKGRSTNDGRRLHEVMERLRRDGLVSRSVLLSSLDRDRTRLSTKHFGSVLPSARDYRGVPLFGWVAGLEAARTDFLVHFDSDVLLHQQTGFSWIEAGAKLIAHDSHVMFVSPLPGPPTTDGGLRGQLVDPIIDRDGNFRFKTFSSRRFLVSKQRFEKMLPTPGDWMSIQNRALMRLGFRNRLVTWEECVSRALQKSEFDRVHLRCPQAWAIHCLDHGQEWLARLPGIIARIEAGDYPAAQAGHYDLILSAWS